ncbi:MAG: ABC transporter substrate-binding protein [Paraclostridium sp.]
MKFKKLASLFLVSALFITGCTTNTTQSNKESDKAVKDTQVEEVDVVAATVSATQVLDKLDANVIGIPTTKMEIPENFKGLPEVGQSMNPDLEIVASLEPDVFIMDSMFKENVEESMKEYDLNTFYFETGTYSEFIDSIGELGKEIKKEKEATELINELKEVEKEATANKSEKAPTVAIIFGGGENFMLATETSYLGDLVKTVGGENITNKLEGDMSSDYVQFSLEQILEQNPDYVLRFAHGNIEETKKAFDEAFDKNPAYKELDAYNNGKVIDLDPAIFNVSANLSVKEAIKTLGTVFYGN